MGYSPPQEEKDLEVSILRGGNPTNPTYPTSPLGGSPRSAVNLPERTATGDHLTLDSAGARSGPCSRGLPCILHAAPEEVLRILVHEVHVAALHATSKQHPVGILHQP